MLKRGSYGIWFQELWKGGEAPQSQVNTWPESRQLKNVLRNAEWGVGPFNKIHKLRRSTATKKGKKKRPQKTTQFCSFVLTISTKNNGRGGIIAR